MSAESKPDLTQKRKDEWARALVRHKTTIVENSPHPIDEVLNALKTLKAGESMTKNELVSFVSCVGTTLTRHLKMARDQNLLGFKLVQDGQSGSYHYYPHPQKAKSDHQTVRT